VKYTSMSVEREEIHISLPAMPGSDVSFKVEKGTDGWTMTGAGYTVAYPNVRAALEDAASVQKAIQFTEALPQSEGRSYFAMNTGRILFKQIDTNGEETSSSIEALDFVEAEGQENKKSLIGLLDYLHTPTVAVESVKLAEPTPIPEAEPEVVAAAPRKSFNERIREANEPVDDASAAAVGSNSGADERLGPIDYNDFFTKEILSGNMERIVMRGMDRADVRDSRIHDVVGGPEAAIPLENIGAYELRKEVDGKEIAYTWQADSTYGHTWKDANNERLLIFNGTSFDIGVKKSLPPKGRVSTGSVRVKAGREERETPGTYAEFLVKNGLRHLDAEFFEGMKRLVSANLEDRAHTYHELYDKKKGGKNEYRVTLQRAQEGEDGLLVASTYKTVANPHPKEVSHWGKYVDDFNAGVAAHFELENINPGDRDHPSYRITGLKGNEDLS